MKRARIITISFLILLFLNSSIVYPQDTTIQQIKVDTIINTITRTVTIVTVWTVPKFILQFNASFLSGSMDLSGHNGGFSVGDFNAGKSFCARNGFGFNLSGKLPLHKKGNIWLDGTAYYNRFVSNLIANNTTEGKVSYNVFGGGLGIDYNFTPAHKVKYFVGANVLFSVINGSALLYYYDVPDTIHNVTIKSSFRIGYSFFVGLEYAINKDFGINAGLKYSHLNLLLKSHTPVTTYSETTLNDYPIGEKETQLYTGWKQFSYSSVFFGFSYYFKVKQYRYKLQ
jgi:hypothetical protein